MTTASPKKAAESQETIGCWSDIELNNIILCSENKRSNSVSCIVYNNDSIIVIYKSSLYIHTSLSFTRCTLTVRADPDVTQGFFWDFMSQRNTKPYFLFPGNSTVTLLLRLWQFHTRHQQLLPLETKTWIYSGFGPSLLFYSCQSGITCPLPASFRVKYVQSVCYKTLGSWWV